MGLVRGSGAAIAAVWRHRAVHPLVMRVRVLRGTPAKALRATRRILPATTVLGATVRAVGGEGRAADDALSAMAAAPWSRRTAAAIATTAALHRPHLAPANPVPDRPRELHAVALLKRERGALSDARALASGTRRLRRFRDIVDGELALLEGAVGRPAAPASGTSTTRDIVHVVTNALPEVVAGYTTRTHGIAAAQARHGRVVVATRLGFPITGGSMRAPLEVVLDDVEYRRRLPRRGESRRIDVATAAEARELVATAHGARILHAHSHHVNGTVAGLAARALGVPWIYEVRGFLEETWIARGGDPNAEFVALSRAAETRVMRAAHHVVTLSAGMRDEVVARGVRPEFVTVVPNAVGTDWLSGPADALAAKARLGISPETLLVGTVSSINGYEGLDLLAPMVARLRALGIDALGVIVGDGPALPQLRGAAGGDHVRFVGRVNTELAREWHRAIDVFTVPRVDSSVTRVVTPIKPLEAMATGSVVIASPLPALREVLPPESGGVLIPREPGAWAEEVARMFRSGELAERGAQATRWIEEHRTWPAQLATYDAVYAAAARRLE